MPLLRTEIQEENYVAPVSANDTFYKVYTDRDVQLYIYSGIIVGLFTFSMLRTLLFFSVCMNASVNLHDWMFKGIIRAPIKFFEANPIGE